MTPNDDGHGIGLVEQTSIPRKVIWTRRRMIYASGALIALAIAIALPLILADRSAASPEAPGGIEQMQAAADQCGGAIGSDWSSVQVNVTPTVIDIGMDYAMRDVRCWLTQLGAPAWIEQEMMGTRALDGMQRASWSGFEASWTYHPDKGLRVVIHVA